MSGLIIFSGSLLSFHESSFTFSSDLLLKSTSLFLPHYLLGSSVSVTEHGARWHTRLESKQHARNVTAVNSQHVYSPALHFDKCPLPHQVLALLHPSILMQMAMYQIRTSLWKLQSLIRISLWYSRSKLCSMLKQTFWSANGDEYILVE